MKNTLIVLVVVAITGFFVYGFVNRVKLAEVNSPTPNATSTPASSKKITMNGVTITPLEVLEDSRCPQGAQCIWAGTLKLKATLSKPSGNFDAVLELGKPVSTGTEEVTLVSASPEPIVEKEIAFADYTFQFTVTTKPAAVQNPRSGGCYVGGCSGQLCTEENGAVSTCEYRESYACYKAAKCERQPSGQCGWTPTATLSACLLNAQQVQ